MTIHWAFTSTPKQTDKGCILLKLPSNGGGNWTHVSEEVKLDGAGAGQFWGPSSPICVFRCACVLSRFSHVQLFATLWTAARQAPLSLEFSRQEYWHGLPCPSPGVLNIILNISGHEMEQDPVLWSSFPMSSVCLLSRKNFSQRSLIREIGKCRNKGK